MTQKHRAPRKISNGNQSGSLSRGIRLPLQQQVYLLLRDHILSNRLQRDHALPSESQLAETYGVSRITIRGALKILEENRLIVRRQGIGTFVGDRIPDVPMRVAMRDQRAHIEELARYTSIKLLELDQGPAPAEVSRWFGASPEEVFYKVVRLRSAARPVLLLTSYTPEWLGSQLSREEYDNDAHYVLLRRAGIRFESGEQIISATLADPVSAAYLNIDVGSPLIRMVFFDFDQNGNPVRHLQVVASPSEFEIHMRIGGAKGSH